MHSESLESIDTADPNIQFCLLRALNKQRAIRLQEFLQFNLQVSFDPGGYIVCDKGKFISTYISKNGTTTLAAYICEQDFSSSGTSNPHDLVGYVLDAGKRLSREAISGQQYDTFVKFAIYRDPVERFVSLYRNKISKDRQDAARPYTYFSKCGIVDVGVDEFIDFAERELTKDIARQDQHIRRQSSYYDPDEVDHIVHLRDLGTFFEAELDASLPKRLNKTCASRVPFTAVQRSRVERLYEKDYQLFVDSPKAYRPIT
jgi:hypothetical protein